MRGNMTKVIRITGSKLWKTTEEPFTKKKKSSREYHIRLTGGSTRQAKEDISL